MKTAKLRRDYPKRPTIKGFPFTDKSGVELLEEDFDKLISRVKEFRAINAFPPGDPEQDVTLFYVEQFPDFVEWDEPRAIKDGDGTIQDDLQKWTRALWVNPPKKLAPKALLNKRMEFCQECPHNHKWKIDMEDDIDLEIHRRIWILSQGEAANNSQLGYCDRHHFFSGLACVIYAPEVSESLDGCWIGKEDFMREEDHV